MDRKTAEARPEIAEVLIPVAVNTAYSYAIP